MFLDEKHKKAQLGGQKKKILAMKDKNKSPSRNQFFSDITSPNIVSIQKAENM